MVEMINAFKGVVMMVADDRVEEYKAAGHRLAATSIEEKPAEAPKKATKKTATKKK